MFGRSLLVCSVIFFFFQAEDGIRYTSVTGVQTCALPISGPQIDTVPVVMTSNVSLHANQTVAASSLFAVNGPNGYAITEYQFWDSTRDAASGHFYVNGVQQAPGTVIDVPASQFGQVTFVTGTLGNSLHVRAFAGATWSSTLSLPGALPISGPQIDTVPVVTTSNVSLHANQTVAASSLFAVNGPNGYAITEYQFWDSTRDAASGHFYVNGDRKSVV